MPTQVKEENFRANLRHIFLFPFCLFDVVPSKQKNHRKSVSVVVRPINTISLTLLLGNIRHAHYSKKKIGGWVDGWVSHSFVVSLKPLCLRWSTLVRKCTVQQNEICVEEKIIISLFGFSTMFKDAKRRQNVSSFSLSFSPPPISVPLFAIVRT